MLDISHWKGFGGWWREEGSLKTGRLGVYASHQYHPFLLSTKMLCTPWHLAHHSPLTLPPGMPGIVPTCGKGSPSPSLSTETLCGEHVLPRALRQKCCHPHWQAWSLLLINSGPKPRSPCTFDLPLLPWHSSILCLSLIDRQSWSTPRLPSQRKTSGVLHSLAVAHTEPTATMCLRRKKEKKWEGGRKRALASSLCRFSWDEKKKMLHCKNKTK